MSSSGNKETGEHSGSPGHPEDGGLQRGGVVGDLSTYRVHVVRLTEGMEDFDGFVPQFAEDEGRTDQILNPSNRDLVSTSR